MINCALARSMSAARRSRPGLLTPSRCRAAWTAGVLTRVACDGWFGCGRALRAHAGIVDGAGRGPGGGQQAAGGPGGCGRLTGPIGCFGGRLGGVLAQAEQGVDMVGKGRSEGAGYVHGVG